MWMITFYICYIIILTFLKVYKNTQTEFWQAGRYESTTEISHEVLIQKQKKWQVEVVETLYQNNFQPVGYRFPYKKEIEEGVLKFYGFMDADDAATHQLLYHFLRVVAAQSTTLHYLRNWNRHSGLVSIFIAMRYWNAKGKAIHSTAQWQPEVDNNLYEYALKYVDFTFAKYPTPRIIVKVWACWEQQVVKDFCKKNISINGSELDKKTPENALFELYFYLANGGALRKNNILKWCFSKKIAHFYMTEIPRHMGWEEAYWYATARAEGITKECAEMLWDAFDIFDLEQFEFWRLLLRQIANLPEQVLKTLDIMGTIETAALIKFGRLPHGEDGKEACFANKEPQFTWKTRKLVHSVAYLERCYTIQYPIPVDFEDSYTIVDRAGDCWHFTLLRNRHELFIEGKAMAHCVGDGDYHYDAVNGTNSFWSLQKRTEHGDLQRALTLEINHEKHYVETALGYENRDAELDENTILAEWCQLVKLKVPVLELAD